VIEYAAIVENLVTGITGHTLDIPPPRITGGQVLYCDFDAVLHPQSVYVKRRVGPFLWNAPGHQLFENVLLLEEVLTPYPNVRIVLSTSWVRRYRGSIARVTRRFTPKLRARAIGATFHSAMDAAAFADVPRGMQIWSDVLRRRPVSWLAIDDDDEGWPAWCRHKLIKTHDVFGISEPSVLAELRSKLESTFGSTP
jgi:hypothetical protein